VKGQALFLKSIYGGGGGGPIFELAVILEVFQLHLDSRFLLKEVERERPVLYPPILAYRSGGLQFKSSL